MDAHKPAEIKHLIETAGVGKSRLPFGQMFVLAVLAGVFIGFGAAAYTVVMTGLDMTYGPSRLLGGVVFSLGLILVIVGGAELFTGNALMVMAAVDRKITVGQLLRNWSLVYVGNLLGAAILAYCIALAALLERDAGVTAVQIAEAKAVLSPGKAFVRGILCNGLVCLAIWLTFAARSVTGKIFAILWPISAFVLLGLEHSVANMYFFPQAWMAGADIGVLTALQNLTFVTLGNVTGGGAGVALAYRFAYLGSSGPDNDQPEQR